MITFSNCKINLGLRIIGKRTDGYHDIETLFYPLPLKDALEIIPSHTFEFHHSGIAIPGDSSGNLCVKAYELLSKDFDIPPVQVFLHKSVPVGAGLGGGSANGAFMLKLLNEKFGLGISDQKMIEYALQLGSDCPFFIINKPCLAYGRGELLKEVGLSLAGYYIVLINPGIHVSTAWAFSQLRSFSSDSIGDLISKPLTSWKKHLHNDFEKPVFEKYPDVQSIKEELYGAGALFASMTGTGSTVFGLFNRKPPKFDYLYTDEILIS